MDLIKYPSGKYIVPTNSPVPTSAGSRHGDNRYPLLSFDFTTSNKPSERNRNANPTLHTSASEKLIEIRERSDQMKDDTTISAGNGESTDIDRELSFTQASHSRKPRHSSISYYEVCATCEHPVENAQIQKTCSTGFRADLFNNSSSDLDSTSSSEDSKANDDDEEEEIFKSPANAVCTSVDGKPSSIKPSKARKACFSPFAYSKLRAASKPHVENAQMRKTRTPDFRADLFNGIGNNFGSRDLLIDVKDNYDDEEYAKISLSPGNEVYTSNDGRRSSMKSSSSRKAYYSPDAYCEVCNTKKIPVESTKLKKSLSTCFLADLYSSDSDDLSSRDLSEDEKKNDDYEEEGCDYGKVDGHLGIALSAAFLNPIFGMLALMAAGSKLYSIKNIDFLYVILFSYII